MSYHGTSTSTTSTTSTARSTTNAQGQTAPTGYHYMPDGSLMLDSAHVGYTAAKVIKSFGLDTSNIKANGETRALKIFGDNGAMFSLEIRNGAKFYNFQTNLFQTTRTKLNNVSIAGGTYVHNVKFPNQKTTDTVNGAVTSGIKVVMDAVVANTMEVGDRVTGNTALDAANVTVAALDPDGDNTSEFSLSQAIAISDGETLSFAGADQYDVYLIAGENTKHSEYREFRYSDGSIDTNLSTGSNSAIITKVLYQTLDVTLTIEGFSPNETITGAQTTSAVITTNRGGTTGKIPFTYVFTVTSTRSLSIDAQPQSKNIMAFIEPVIGANPITIPGEDIYPAVSNTDTVDSAVASGTRYVMDTNVNVKMKAGDKITTAVTTDTVDGGGDPVSFTAISRDNVAIFGKIVMDNNVAGKMNVGDAITGTSHFDEFAALGSPIQVAQLNPDGDNVKEFSFGNKGNAHEIQDGATLTFSSILNRETITVDTLNPDDDNAKEFSSSAAFSIRDGATLSFSNQRNFRWPISSTGADVSKITPGMRQPKGIVFEETAVVKNYVESIVESEGTAEQRYVEKLKIPAIETFGAKPLMVRDAITKVVTKTTGNATNPVNITFDKQALLIFAGTTTKIFSYGINEIKRLLDYNVEFSDLTAVLTPVVTNTTAAVNSSTSIPIANRAGIMDAISSVSGIGINPSVAAPTVASGAGSVTGAGTIVLSAAQTLENGAELTFPGAGSVVTISGNVKVNSAGNVNETLRFDLEKFLTMH